MTRPCRLMHAHTHCTLPAGTIGTVAVAKEQAPDGMRVLRIRWLDSREWEVCYGPTAERPYGGFEWYRAGFRGQS